MTHSSSGLVLAGWVPPAPKGMAGTAALPNATAAQPAPLLAATHSHDCRRPARRRLALIGGTILRSSLRQPWRRRLMPRYAGGLQDGPDALVCDAIADPWTLLAADDQANIAQDAQLLRDIRLTFTAQMRERRHVADLSFRQQYQHAQPARVCHCAE